MDDNALTQLKERWEWCTSLLMGSFCSPKQTFGHQTFTSPSSCHSHRQSECCVCLQPQMGGWNPKTCDPHIACSQATSQILQQQHLKNRRVFEMEVDFWQRNKSTIVVAERCLYQPYVCVLYTRENVFILFTSIISKYQKKC